MLLRNERRTEKTGNFEVRQYPLTKFVIPVIKFDFEMQGEAKATGTGS